MSETDKPAPPAVEPADLVLRRDERGRLVLDPPAGDPVAGVRVARCFPWSRREGYVSVRDEEGREVCLVRGPGDLREPARRIVEEELAAQEFLPRITAVHEIDDEFDVMVWAVDTDRGPVELQVKSTEDIRVLDDGRILIRDHAGGTFVVEDPAALDPRSRRLVEDRLG